MKDSKEHKSNGQTL